MHLFDQPWPFVESSRGVFTQKAAADRNRLRILGLISRRRCRSQRQLVLATGLQPSTVSNIVRSLKTQGIIREGAPIEADRVGPKETQLDLAADSLWSCGVSLDVLGHRLLLVNAAGHVLAQDSLPPGLAPSDLAPQLADRIRAAAKDANLDLSKLGGIGISAPGVVDSTRGTVLISRSLGLKEFPLGPALAESLGCPVWVERNVDCGSYAEHHAGVARDQTTFIYFLLRCEADQPLSFGLSLVIEERIFHGSNSAAGEVDRNLLAESVTAPLRDRHCGEAATGAFYAAFAQTLAGIINLLDINCLVLSSNDDRLTAERLARLRESVANNLVPVPERRLQILRSGLGPDGVLLGSALLAAHRGLARWASPPQSKAKPARKKFSR
jgi:predicted NBD/HSP70 family sugar kinase